MLLTGRTCLEVKTKNKILLLYPYYWPFYGAGGPVQSLFNLVDFFSESATFYLISHSKDINGENSALPIQEDVWVQGPNHEYCYYTKTISPFTLLKVFNDCKPDVVLINGVFHWHTSFVGVLLARMKGVSTIVSPRGMLQPWALSRGKVKKKIFLFFFELLLTKNIRWHATNEQEQNEILNIFGKDQLVFVAPNIPRKVSAGTKIENFQSTEKIKLVFLSLINPNKNLHVAIDAVSADSNRFSLDIYGPIIDENYWSKCSTLLKADSIIYKGSVPPWEVPSVLQEYHFFVLPTEGENFGHAIFDSLASGVPVIITDRTPWQNVDSHNAGFYINLTDKNSLPNVLEKIATLSNEEYNQYRSNSIRYAKTYLSGRNFIEEYAFLLQP